MDYPLIDVGVITPSDVKNEGTELNCNWIIVKDNGIKDVKVVMRDDPTETAATLKLGANQATNGAGWFCGNIKYVLDTGTTANNLLYGYDSRLPGITGKGTHASTHPLTPNANKKFGYINVND